MIMFLVREYSISPDGFCCEDPDSYRLYHTYQEAVEACRSREDEGYSYVKAMSQTDLSGVLVPTDDIWISTDFRGDRHILQIHTVEVTS